MIPRGIGELARKPINLVATLAVAVATFLGPFGPEPEKPRPPAKITKRHRHPTPRPIVALPVKEKRSRRPPRAPVLADRPPTGPRVTLAIRPGRLQNRGDGGGPASAARPVAPWRAEILTLVMNEVVRGNEIVYFWGTDVWVSAAALSDAGLARRGRTTYFDRLEYVALESLPVTFVVDEDHMALRITARAADLPSSQIDLAANQAPIGIEYGNATSMYVNYGAHSFGTRIDAFAETGIRVGNALAYGSVALLPDQRVVRGLTNVTWDRRAELQRVVAGDELVNAGPLGGGGVVGGVHLVRGFDLDPYLVTAPSIDMTSTVLAPSTADVYINGVLVRSVQLAPGQYTLKNLPVTSGAGDVRVVVRDALGRQRQLATGYYMASNLLKVGLSDYQFAAGALRERVGLASFDYGGPVAVARYARGLTSTITAGVRADATPEHAGAGGSITAGLPIGQLDAAVSASTDRGSLGAAGLLAWSYASRRGSISVSGRRVSARYATIDVDRDGDRELVDLRIQGSVALGARTSLGAQVSTIEFRDSGWSRRMAVQSTTSFARRYTLTVAAGRDETWGQPGEYDLSANLSIGLSARTRASISHSLGATDKTELEIHHSFDGTDPGVGYRLLADVGSDDRVAGNVQAQTRSGRYGATYTYDEQHGGTAELSAAGGIALIGGRVFLSTPIERSFALVRVPHVSGIEASLENHPVGHTDDEGDVFIPNLQPYYGNNISIAAGDLPIDRQLPEVHRIVAPPSGGGTIILFAATKLHLVRGSLQIGRGSAHVIPAFGELVIAGTPTPFVSPIGRDGEFELDGIGAGHHAATIDWDGGTCTFELVVAPDDRPITDLGAILCTMRGDAR